MCGILGFVGKGSLVDLSSMGACLAHRGPDGHGLLTDEIHRVFLLHKRLAIMDIDGGSQPMWNENNQICVIFNGEIYNHSELRRELISKGHTFKSHHCDTEVLVHGYEEWGTDLPIRLNGMFSFAIYDKSTLKLFLARDRFGEKPLYYSVKNNFFAFSSEATALLKHPNISNHINHTALKKYFAYGFIPSPHSLYKDIQKLPGGHWMSYDLSKNQIKTECYWQFRIEPYERLPKHPEDEWGEELSSILSSSVKSRLIADVPVGIFLSGGIDSSTILAFASEHLKTEQIKTFSIGFNEDSFDESVYAKKVARIFGSNHFNEILSVTNAKALLPKVLLALDEPISDPSILPTYLLCNLARKHVKVALGGDGSDELFAGYDPFKALNIAKWYQHLTLPCTRLPISRLFDKIPPSPKNMSFGFKIKRGLRGAAYKPSLWNPIWLAPLDPKEIAEQFCEPVDINSLYEDAIKTWEESPNTNLLDRSLEFYTRFYLQDNIMTKVDRSSMLNSLEVRSPFLDNNVVEFARKIPSRYKLKHGQTKHILKCAIRNKLPKDILHRQKKGFGIPSNVWIKELGLKCPESSVMPFISHKKMQGRWDSHLRGKSDDQIYLWGLTALNYHIKNNIGNQN